MQYRNKNFIYLVSAIAAIGGFLFGFDTGIISGALIFIQQTFHLSTLSKEIIVSSVVFGAFVGAMCSGRLADHFGRKKMLIVAAITFLIGTGLSTFAAYVFILVIGRFILGLAIGVASFTVPLFISEMAPANKRGRLVLLNAITITTGEAIAFIVDEMLVPTHSWRLMFATGFIPATLLLIGMLFLPSTPRWLSLKGLVNEATSVLRLIRHKQDVYQELDEIKKSIHEKTGGWRDLFSKRVRPVLLVGLALGVLQQFVGINTVMYYGPYIFKAAGFQSASSQILVTFGMGVVNAIMSIVAVFTVDYFGRRKLLIGGMIVAFTSLTIVGEIFNFNTPLAHAMTVLFMVLYIAGYAISLGSLFWLIIAEIYPLNIRGLAMSFVTGVQWLANFVVAMTFLTILNTVGPSLTFWLYALMCGITILFTFFMVPETKNISLELIEQNLDARKPSRELGHPVKGK